MDLEERIEKLNFVEEEDKIEVELGRCVDSKDESKKGMSFEAKVIEKIDSNPVELITDFSPEGADDYETVALYSTRLEDAYEGESLKFGAKVYAVFPKPYNSYEITSVKTM